MIRIENISKDLGEFFLKDVTLDINDSEYFIVLGPTGAGKTILLETIAGIYQPDKGKVFLDGRDITNISLKDRRISVVYQDYMLFPHLTVAQNIGFGLRSKKVPKGEIKKKTDESACLLGVSHLLHRYPGTLSGGEKQKVAIARAMVTEPKALLLDEPLSALDAQTVERLRQELKKIHSITKITTIHVTHSFEEALFLGDRMAVMDKGEIIQVGKPSEVFRKPNSKFVADFLAVGNLFEGESTIDKGVSYIDVGGISIASTTPKYGKVSISIRPEDILVSKKPLESSALNTFEGKVEDVIDKGTVVELVVDVGIPLVAMITKISFEELGLEKGISVYLTFKASAVHIF